MKLVNPGPGEQTDRLTILALKILFGVEAGKDVAHFERERAVLLTQVRARASQVDLEAVLALAAVNAALWHAEDDLRALRRGVMLSLSAALDSKEGIALAVYQQAGEVAFRIQDLNDQRAKLVGEINARSGEAVTGDEKI